MIAFIDEYREQFGVEAICRILGATECGFITSRGYRAAKTRPVSARSVRDEILIEEARRIHQENYSVYGVRKMWHAMRHAGWNVGRDQVARLMKVAGIQGVRRGRKPVTTRPAGGDDQRPDLVERRFAAKRPQQRSGMLRLRGIRAIRRTNRPAWSVDSCPWTFWTWDGSLLGWYC